MAVIVDIEWTKRSQRNATSCILLQFFADSTEKLATERPL